jgi:hypothetical protein
MKVDWKKFIEAEESMREDCPYEQEYEAMVKELESKGILSLEREKNYRVLTGGIGFTELLPKTEGWYGPQLYFTRRHDALEYASLQDYNDVSVEKIGKVFYPEER